MTWLRWDTDAAFADVVDDLAHELRLPPSHVFGLYVACCLGFGQHRPDGMIAPVKDSALEAWARWSGKPGRWAAAFRARCTDEAGMVRGWWRNSALLRKQELDARKRKPPKNPRETREGFQGEPPKNPRQNDADDGRTEDGDGNGDELLPTNLPARLSRRLMGQPGRHAIVEFLERLPPAQDPAAWHACLLGCLQGLALEQGRAATVGELAVACSDYLGTAPSSWGLPHFRSFVERVVAKRFRPERRADARGSRTDRAIDAARTFAAEGGEG